MEPYLASDEVKSEDVKALSEATFNYQMYKKIKYHISFFKIHKECNCLC